MVWMPPENSIDQRQISIIQEIEQNPNGCYWVKGFAGSGKTVILVQFAKRFLVQNPGATVAFATFTHALKDMVRSGFPESLKDRVFIGTYFQFLKQEEPVDLLLLDEVQDIPRKYLKKLKKQCDWLVVAGDSDQRIYVDGEDEEGTQAILEPCLSNKLIKIYRLTEKLCRVAQVIFPSAQLELATNANVGIKKGSDVYYKKYNTKEEEIIQTWEQAKREAVPGRPSVILFSTHKMIRDFALVLADYLGLGEPPQRTREEGYEEFNEFWRQNSIPLEYLGNNQGELLDGEHYPMVYVMTYHSSKGLDFERAFIPFLDYGAFFTSQKNLDEIPDLDRRLLYVASTRSRSDLYLSYSSWKPHKLLQEIIDSGRAKELIVQPETEDEDEDDFF